MTGPIVRLVAIPCSTDVRIIDKWLSVMRHFFHIFIDIWQWNGQRGQHIQFLENCVSRGGVILMVMDVGIPI